MANNAQAIRDFILDQVDKHPSDIVKVTTEEFSVTRTTVHRHLQHLIKNGLLVKSGTTKQVRYARTNSLKPKFSATLDPTFDESQFYAQYCEPFILKFCSTNTESICEYGITEMLNNCKDHSKGSHAHISLSVDTNNLTIEIQDNGLGVLHTLKETLKLEDPREILFELSKGKLTRDPNNHSGEGIFFTSRLFDTFEIITNGFRYTKINTGNDWGFARHTETKGTQVVLTIARQSTRKISDVFKAYQDEETLEFIKTDIIIELADKPGSRLIARSQAKRVCANLDKFKHATLDFKNVAAVGQGFVDQVFRVYKNQHSNITFNYINANDDVRFMIERSTANSPK